MSFLRLFGVRAASARIAPSCSSASRSPPWAQNAYYEYRAWPRWSATLARTEPRKAGFGCYVVPARPGALGRQGLPTRYIATCEARGINPFDYLVDVLAGVQDHPANAIDELLPSAWHAAD
jgi:hypothetical protein